MTTSTTYHVIFTQFSYYLGKHARGESLFFLHRNTGAAVLLWFYYITIETYR